MAQARAHSDCANLMLMSNASSNSSMFNNKNNAGQEQRTSARQKSKLTNSTFDGRSPENTIKTMQ